MIYPIDWIKTINKEAHKAIRNKQSRYSVEWGKWSFEMNRRIRAQVEENDPHSPRLKFVFMYWVQMSRAVEFAYKMNTGQKIDAKLFADTVDHLEDMKAAIAKGIWPKIEPKTVKKIRRFEEVPSENRRPLP